MNHFGTYRFTYEPAPGTVEAGMEMSISGEATIEQMLELYTAFLKANGYPLHFDDDVRIINERKQEECSVQRFAEIDHIPLHRIGTPV